MKKITVSDIWELKNKNEIITAITAYDAQIASFASRAGIEIILVGDSLGMTALGYKTTIPVTLEQMLHHTAAVVRGNKGSLVIADMPFMTYQVNPEDALRNSARFIKEAQADAVKLEGGKSMVSTILKLVTSGIPVLAHIGMLPQSILKEGKYRTYGKSVSEVDILKADALAVQEAGAFALVLECIKEDLAEEISQMLDIPTIGIGSGDKCDGQIQVVSDVLGLCPDFVPKHAKVYTQGYKIFTDAISNYRNDVKNGK